VLFRRSLSLAARGIFSDDAEQWRALAFQIEQLEKEQGELER